MTFSTSCSGRTADLAALVLACACAQRAPRPAAAAPPPPPDPIAVLPLENVTGFPIPARDLQTAVEAALRDAGLPLVRGAPIDAFLARHRVRWTGGVDAETAQAAGAELGVSGVLVTNVEAYDESGPKIALAMRLVSADAVAHVRWMDAVARKGDESPGLFDLGVVRELPVLREQALGTLARDLLRFVSGAGSSATACSGNGRFAPKQSFRSPQLDSGRPQLIAVLPFVNETEYRHAGRVVAMQFARELQASGRFQVLEPGVVRNDLLQFRIVMEGGLSLDAARVLLELTRADAALTGFVREYTDAGPSGAPAVQFTALLLSRDGDEVVWEATSYSHGDDGVVFFDFGLVATAPALACDMVHSAIADLLAPAPRRPRLALPGPRR